MSSLMSSHGMALATAMAVSGTVILMALCRQKPLFTAGQFDASARCSLRPCIASAERKREKGNKKKKMMRVRFAEDVVVVFDGEISSSLNEEVAQEFVQIRDKVREMPANRAALYNGIMQDRLQRMACY